MFKIKHRLPLRGAFFLSAVSFLLSLSMSFVAPIYPLFLKEFVKSDAFVGYVVTFGSVLLILCSFVVVSLLRKYHKASLMRIALVGYAITFLLIPLMQTINQLLFLTALRAFFTVMALTMTSLFIKESVRRKKELGKTEGMYFAVLNVAWLIGPLIGGPFAKHFGFTATFLFASVFAFLSFFLWAVESKNFVQDNGELETNNKHFFQNLKEYFKKRNHAIIYLLSFGLPFWWALIYVYIPLWLATKAVSEAVIGYALFLVVIPLIALELPIGKLADKKGYRWLLALGYVIMAIFGLIAAYTESYIILIALFVIGCFGTALVEPLREAFFFKITKKPDEVRFFSVYRTAFDLGYVIAPLFYSTILFTGSYKFVFMGGAACMLVFSILALGLKENDHLYY